jgi:hypothetical protein
MLADNKKQQKTIEKFIRGEGKSQEVENGEGGGWQCWQALNGDSA